MSRTGDEALNAGPSGPRAVPRTLPLSCRGPRRRGACQWIPKPAGRQTRNRLNKILKFFSSSPSNLYLLVGVRFPRAPYQPMALLRARPPIGYGWGAWSALSGMRAPPRVWATGPCSLAGLLLVRESGGRRCKNFQLPFFAFVRLFSACFWWKFPDGLTREPRRVKKKSAALRRLAGARWVRYLRFRLCQSNHDTGRSHTVQSSACQ